MVFLLMINFIVVIIFVFVFISVVDFILYLEVMRFFFGIGLLILNLYDLVFLIVFFIGVRVLFTLTLFMKYFRS